MDITVLRNALFANGADLVPAGQKACFIIIGDPALNLS